MRSGAEAFMNSSRGEGEGASGNGGRGWENEAEAFLIPRP
jgi:hypothetical protein